MSNRSVRENLDLLVQTKSNIKSIMEENGIEITDGTPFSEYVNLIETMSDGSVSFINVRNEMHVGGGDSYSFNLEDYGDVIIFYYGEGVSNTRASVLMSLEIKFAGSTAVNISFSNNETLLGIITEPSATGVRNVYYTTSLSTASIKTGGAY